jgi:hypothetical protein
MLPVRSREGKEELMPEQPKDEQIERGLVTDAAILLSPTLAVAVDHLIDRPKDDAPPPPPQQADPED